MKKVNLIFGIILINLLSINQLYSQWNKVNEHFELQRAKNTKILNYTTYEEDNNLVVIDESGEITEYKMDTGELTKTCNCIKDSTFEYAQVLEDKETVVLGKKYVDSLILDKYAKGVSSYELFFVNKNECKNNQNYKLHLMVDTLLKNYGKGYQDYNQFEIILKNIILNKTKDEYVFHFNLIYKSTQNTGNPAHYERDLGFVFVFDNNLKFKSYNEDDYLVNRINLNNDKYQYALLNYYYIDFYNFSHQNANFYFKSESNEVTIFESNSTKSKEILRHYQYSNTTNGVTESGGQFIPISQIFQGSDYNKLYIRMKDSLITYNIGMDKFENTKISSIFNQEFFSIKNNSLFIGLEKNKINIIDINSVSIFDVFNLPYDSINTTMIIDNLGYLISKCDENKLVKTDLKNYLSKYPNEGFTLSNNITYSDKTFTLYALSNELNNQYYWNVNGKEYKTSESTYTLNINEVGTYDISLKILTSNNKELLYEKKQAIIVKEKLIPDFYYIININNPLQVKFTNKSQGDSLKFQWIINYDKITKQDLVYNFKEFGEYEIKLIISDGYRKEEVVKTISLGSNDYIVKSGLVSNFYNDNDSYSYDNILKTDSFYIVFYKYEEVASESDVPTRYSRYYNLKLFDNMFKYKNVYNICGMQYKYFKDYDPTSYMLLDDKTLLFRKTECYIEYLPYSNYLYSDLSNLTQNQIIKNDFFIDGLFDSDIVKYYTNNKNKIYCEYHKNNDSILELSVSDFDYTNIKKIKVNLKYTNYFIQAHEDFLYFINYNRDSLELVIFNNNLEILKKQTFNNNVLYSNYLQINVLNIKVVNSNNIYLYGKLKTFADNSFFGFVSKLDFSKSNINSKIFYSRKNITQIEVINDKYLAVSGDTRSLQGYMILDNDLNLEKDIRYATLSGYFRKMFINNDTIEIFAGNLNYIKDKIDGNIMLSANNDVDKSLINIYPNPASDKTTIDLSELHPLNSEINVTAYDVIGNKVANLFRGNLNSKYIEVDTIILPIGNFMVVVSDGNKIISKPIAIMR